MSKPDGVTQGRCLPANHFKMKIFIQDHGWAGATIVVAENEEQARARLRALQVGDYTCYYEETKPFDKILDCVAGAAYEVFGDR